MHKECNKSISRYETIVQSYHKNQTEPTNTQELCLPRSPSVQGPYSQLLKMSYFQLILSHKLFLIIFNYLVHLLLALNKLEKKKRSYF